MSDFIKAFVYNLLKCLSSQKAVFFGKVADNNDMKIKEKFFCGEIQRGLETQCLE